MINLKDKKILVLGATGGVGSSLAHVLDSYGASLVLSGRNIQKLDELISSLSSKGHYAVPFDVRNIYGIGKFIKDVVDLDSKKLDGVVYSAATIPVVPIKNSDYDFMLDVMNINFFAFAEVVRHFSNRKNHNANSSVVVLSSYASINADKAQLAYAASKGAIDSSVVVMAKELFCRQIRVNSIRPAIIKTDEVLNQRQQEIVEAMQTGMIEQDKLSHHIAFLLSEASSGVYGRCFEVRGCLS